MFTCIGEDWILLARPVWLMSLPAAVLPALLAWWASSRGRPIPVPAVAAQCLALAALSVAMAGPMAALGGRGKSVYVLMADRSGSVRGQEQAAGRLKFPAGAGVERFGFAGGLSRSGEPDDIDSTRISPVLRMIGSGDFGNLTAAVILTDGQFAQEDFSGAAASVAGRGIDVFVVPLDRPPPDARIVAFAAGRISARDVEITAAVTSNSPLRRTLTIARSDLSEPLMVQTIGLLGDSPAAVRVTDSLAPDAWARYSARLTGDSNVTENDSAAAIVLPARQRVAVVGDGLAYRPMLRKIGYPITYVRPGALPAEAAELARFSGIIVVDSTGSALRLPQRRALSEYVTGGGAVMMIGTGPHEKVSDENDPLNRVLPLVANPFQRRPLGLAVLLDKSGSMAQPAESESGGGGPAQIKFDLAAEAVVALKDHLTDRDTLKIIAFAGKPVMVYDSGPKPADFASVREALKRVGPAGPTRVTPAIAMAMENLPDNGLAPMLLIVSDSRTEDFDPAEWSEALKRAGIRLAVVAVAGGSATDHDPDATGTERSPLERLAALMDAPYVRRDSLAGLAKVFADMVRRGRGNVVRRGLAGVVVEAPLFGSGPAALPDLEAYILSAAGRGGRILARTARTVGGGGGDPVLGVSRAGLGRTVCLAVPVRQDVNAAWARSDPAARLVSSALQWCIRGVEDSRFDLTTVRKDGALLVTVEARQMGDGAGPRSVSNGETPINSLSLKAEVAGGELVRAVKLDQTAPGRYAAEIAWPSGLPAAVVVRDGTGAAVRRGSAGVLYRPEYRAIGADYESLRRLARLTGGRVVPASRLGETLGRSRRRGMTDLWPWLIGVALAVMLAEWIIVRVVRRWPG